MEVPKKLLRYVEKGKCALFVGSGISMPAGLPSWKTLIEGLLNELPGGTLSREMRAALQQHFEAGDFLQVADFCKRNLLPGAYTELLNNAVGGHRDQDQLKPLHEMIVGLPFRSIITTNFDLVLEDAFLKFAKRQPKVVTGSDGKALGTLLFNEENVFILKAHGCIDRSHDKLVLTAADYRQMIHSSPAFTAFFNALLLNYAVLFVGYSLRDPDFQLLMDQHFMAFGGFTPPRYALMADVDPAQADFLRQSNIEVIPYATAKNHADPHQQVTEFFKYLSQNVDTQKPVDSAGANFGKVAGLSETSSFYNICYTHKGHVKHALGNYDLYRMPPIAFDEAEIVFRTWNLATMCTGKGWSAVRMVCSCHDGGDLEQQPLCIVGSPKGNPYAARLMTALERLQPAAASAIDGAEPPAASTSALICPIMKVERVSGQGVDASEVCFVVGVDRTRYVPPPAKDGPLDADGASLTDYALLLVLPNLLAACPGPEQKILLLAGCRVAGQVAINRWFTNSVTLANLRDRYGGGSFYVLLEVRYRFIAEQLPAIVGTTVIAQDKIQMP